MRTCTKKLAPHLLESLCKGYINAKNAYGEVLTIPELNIEIRYIPQSNYVSKLIQPRPYGKQYSAFLRCVKQIEAGQNTVFVGKKWMMISMEHYKKIADIVQNKTNDDLKLKLIPGGRMTGKRHIREQLRKIWKTTPLDTDSKEFRKHNKEQLDEIRKYYRDNDIETDGMNYMMRGNYIDAVFGTPEEREKKRKSLQNEKNEVERAEKNYLSTIKNLTNQKREETMKSNIGIAQVCHEANRQYCIDNKLSTQALWNELPVTQQNSIIYGVEQVIADPKLNATKMHDYWMNYKASEGWKYAKELDAAKKLHPNMVPFNKLPEVERAKDMLFIKTVKAEMKK